MNTPTDPFEEELRSLQPATPSLRLASRIAADLAGARAPGPAAGRRFAPRDLSLWLSWGVAAAMAVALFTRTPPASTTGAELATRPAPEASAAAPARFTPVSSTNTLVGALDEGVVFLEDGRPARKVRYEYVDTVNLLGVGDSRATIAVTTPREEIRLVPVETL
jgi:hypothetical protein